MSEDPSTPVDPPAADSATLDADAHESTTPIERSQAALSWITQLGSISGAPSTAHGSPASLTASSIGGTDLLSDLELSRVFPRPSSAPPSSHSGEESSGSAPHSGDHASALVFPRLGLDTGTRETSSEGPTLRLIVTGGSGEQRQAVIDALASSRVRVAHVAMDEVEERYEAHRARLSDVFADHLSPSLQRLMLAILGTSTNAMLADACLVIVDASSVAVALSAHTSVIAVLAEASDDVPFGSLTPGDLVDQSASSPSFTLPVPGEDESTLASILRDVAVPRRLRHRNARAFVRWRRDGSASSVASEGEREAETHPSSVIEPVRRPVSAPSQLDSSAVLGSSGSERATQLSRRRRTICGPAPGLFRSISPMPLGSSHDPLNVRSLVRVGLGAAASTLLGVGLLVGVFATGAVAGWLGSLGVRALGEAVHRRLL